MKIVKFLFLSLYLLFANTAYAANEIGLDRKKKPGGIDVSQGSPEELFGNVFNNAIALLFTVGALGFIIMFLWGAVDWILSGGDKEKIAGARKRIVTAITGLVLLSLTFVIIIVLGQVLDICYLRQFKFPIPSLVTGYTSPCK